MPRTAILAAVTHDGKDVLISGKKSPLLETIKKFKEFRAKAAVHQPHEQYAEVYFQESDGHLQMVRFNTPEKQKAMDAQRAKETAANKKAMEAMQKRDEKAADIGKPMTALPPTPEKPKEGDSQPPAN